MRVDGDCVACGHRWVMHPVAILGLGACADCLIEQDDQLRDDICDLVPPGLAKVPASHFMTAVERRDRLGRRSIRLISSDAGWEVRRIQPLGWATPARAQAMLDETTEALERLPVMDFYTWWWANRRRCKEAVPTGLETVPRRREQGRRVRR